MFFLCHTSARISLSLSSRFPINNLYLYNAKILHKENVVCVISVHPRARSPVTLPLQNLKLRRRRSKSVRAKPVFSEELCEGTNPEYFKLPIVFAVCWKVKITWVFKISVTIISAVFVVACFSSVANQVLLYSCDSMALSVWSVSVQNACVPNWRARALLPRRIFHH